MTKIEIVKTVKERQEIELEFPFFYEAGDSFDSGGSYQAYYRLDRDGRRHCITRRDNNQWEYECDRVSVASALGWLGEPDQYYYQRSSRDEFYAKLAEFQATLSAIPV